MLSLSNITEMEVGPCERPVDGVDNLQCLEISSEEVARRWTDKFGPEVYEASSSFVDTEYDELVEYVATAPGIQVESMLHYNLERARDWT
jgi:anion-transporting  ArsA/GET3 family ATPase